MCSNFGGFRCSIPLRMATSWDASCLQVVVEGGGDGSSATDVDVPAFDEYATMREARMRERAGARGYDQE